MDKIKIHHVWGYRRFEVYFVCFKLSLIISKENKLNHSIPNTFMIRTEEGKVGRIATTRLIRSCYIIAPSRLKHIQRITSIAQDNAIGCPNNALKLIHWI